MKKKKRPFRCLCCGVVFGNDNNIDQQYVAEGLCRSCYRGRCKNPDYQPEITYHHLSQRRSQTFGTANGDTPKNGIQVVTLDGGRGWPNKKWPNNARLLMQVRCLKMGVGYEQEK